MTPENFCYWLKGIFEIQEAGLDKNQKCSIKLTDAQIEMINQHLGYVFAPKIAPTPASPFTPPPGTVLAELSKSGVGAIC